ncbi:unnamed protein product [Mytilus edulis]|uniref:Uncharacterized protein n=1 Tax=Mytilus edulis TaxID=6550 RepID=A0A8S3RB37_MYTED|nr:unnamed protein product [Mytilus edulis]
MVHRSWTTAFSQVGICWLREILKRDPGFDGYSLPDIHKLIKVDVDRRFTLIKDSDSGCWKIRANQGYSLMVDTPAIPLEEKCEVPQGNLFTAALLTGDQEGSVANIMREPIGTIFAVENHSSIQKVAATTETTLASDEEAQESWDSTSDSEAHTTLVEGASDEKIVTVFPTPVVDGGMTDNTENSHTSLTFEDPSSTGETTESNSPLNNEKVITLKSAVNKESVYINPESPDLGLGLLFKTGNVGTRYFNQQKPPPVDSGASVFCVSTVRSGPNRRQWDPGIPYPNKGIKTVQVRKNETKLFTMENGSAQLPGSKTKNKLKEDWDTARQYEANQLLAIEDESKTQAETGPLGRKRVRANQQLNSSRFLPPLALASTLNSPRGASNLGMEVSVCPGPVRWKISTGTMLQLWVVQTLES